jgi:hypothetical protein
MNKLEVSFAGGEPKGVGCNACFTLFKNGKGPIENAGSHTSSDHARWVGEQSTAQIHAVSKLQTLVQTLPDELKSMSAAIARLDR